MVQKKKMPPWRVLQIKIWEVSDYDLGVRDLGKSVILNLIFSFGNNVFMA
jgi:hypothetical protein